MSCLAPGLNVFVVVGAASAGLRHFHSWNGGGGGLEAYKDGTARHPSAM